MSDLGECPIIVSDKATATRAAEWVEAMAIASVSLHREFGEVWVSWTLERIRQIVDRDDGE